MVARRPKPTRCKCYPGRVPTDPSSGKITFQVLCPGSGRYRWSARSRPAEMDRLQTNPCAVELPVRRTAGLQTPGCRWPHEVREVNPLTPENLIHEQRQMTVGGQGTLSLQSSRGQHLPVKKDWNQSVTRPELCNNACLPSCNVVPRRIFARTRPSEAQEQPGGGHQTKGQRPANGKALEIRAVGPSESHSRSAPDRLEQVDQQ